MQTQLAFPFSPSPVFVLSPELAARCPSIFEDDDGSYSSPVISGLRPVKLDTTAQLAATKLIRRAP